MNAKLYSVFFAAPILFAGCSSAQKGPVPIPNARTISGDHREWWDIYSVEYQGDRKVRTKVGYLYRKYSDENPKGFYWVKDLTLSEPDLGFFLPDYKAYLIVRGTNGKLESQDLGISDRDLGLKKILQLPASSIIELEKVLPRPASLTPPPVSAAAR